ncbi:GNAT family N-acetyltransferase [Candidatus Poribacteria bacterium]
MEVIIRPLESSDVKEVVQGWNSSLIYDQVSEERFESVILKDPNHEKGASLVAICDGEIVGLISTVARKGISGADGRGGSHDADRGYMKGFFVLERFRRQGIGTKLLDESAKYLRSKGKSTIRVITYTGSYFFPGVGLRYESGVRFFEDKGFRRDHVIDDMDLDLKNFQISDYQKDARRRTAEFDVRIEEYDPSMLDRMRTFVEKANMTSWFPEGWEEGYRKKGNKFVALKGEEIVGWASYWPRAGTAGFGPIAVLNEMRGHGIGSCLLLESVLSMKEAGADRVFASWTNTPFYVPNGWKICRQYAVFERNIE